MADQPQFETWRILHIDDDEDDRIIVGIMLREARGQRVTLDWAASYEEGYRKLAANHYQAVLVDYDLQVGNGIELIREFVQRGYSAPIILLTGRGGYEVDMEAMRAGATLYLAKNEINPLLLERSIRYAIERKQTELLLQESNEVLRQSEARFARLFQSNPAGLAITRLSDGRYIDVNDSFCRMFGYTRSEVVGRTPFDLNIYPEPKSREELVRRLQADGSISNSEMIFRTKSGEFCQVLVSIELLEFEHQPVLLSSIIDISERKRVEEALRASEATLRGILDATKESIWLFDLEGRIRLGNQTAHTRVQRSAEELQGRGYEAFLPDELAQSRRARINEVIRSGKPVEFEDQRGAKSFLHSYYPVLDPSGQVKSVAAFSRDITERKRADQAVRDIEARLRDFLENTHDSLYILDHEWRFLFANRRYTEILGTNSNELVGKNFWELFPRYIGTPVEHHFHKVMRERVPAHFQMGGAYSAAWYDLSVYPTQEGISVFAVDRTEQHQAQEALRQREAELQSHARELEAILEAAPVYMWITHDPQAREMTGNSRVYELMRMQPGDNLSATPAEPEKLSHVRIMREGTEIRPEELLVQKAAVSGTAIRDYEFDLVFEDGEVRHLLGNVSPLHDEQGNPAGAVSAFIDITARKTIEQKLQESENRFRVALASAPITVYTTDRALRLTWMHDFHPRFDSNQVLGLRLDQVMPGEYGDALIAIQQSVIDTGQARQGEIETWVDGQQFYYTYYIDPIRDAAGTITGLACAGYDITGRKQIEQSLTHYAQELERSNRALQDFAFMASHDLQEPLRKIVMFGNNLSSRLSEAGDEKAVDYLERMLQAAERMQAMIRGLLNLSRVNTHGSEFVPLDLTGITREVVSDLEQRIQASGGHVTVEALPAIEGDPLQIAQLLQNLIGNALKYHKEGVPPVVRVTGEQIRTGITHQVCIVVEDNGIGFEEDEAEKIFQPFVRLHGRSPYEGAGIGLAICRTIVIRHGGSITASSRPGEGSRFTILLPAPG